MTEEHFSELDRVGQHAEKRLGSSTTAAAASVGMAIPESHIVRKIALLNRETREITSLESCRMLLVLMLMLLMLLMLIMLLLSRIRHL